MTYIPQTFTLENVSRRGVLKGAVYGSGLVLMAKLLPGQAQAYSIPAYANGGADMPHGVVNDPKVFVSIAPDGTVTIIAARAEMGTGAARTSLPMIVAEEMNADWAHVKVVQGDGDEPRYGNQDTDGSRSVRHFLQPMRQIGVATRLMLEAAAAKKWSVDPSQVESTKHEVVLKGGTKKLGYGELAADAAAMPMPAMDVITKSYKDPSTYRYVGKGNVGIVDLFDITVGKAMYGADHRLPGQLYAMIARPPVMGGKVKSFDATDAMKVPGVVKVIEAKGWQPPGTKFLPVGGVAVIAKNTAAAEKGRAALKIEWDDGPNASYDSDAYRKELEAAVNAPGVVERNLGDYDAAEKSGGKVVSASYYAPHISHAQMEPVAALASFTRVGEGGASGKLEIWAPVQSPWGTREDAAKLLELPVENVAVHTTLLGGGFGRKSQCDFVLEAALLSKEMGAPVQMQWTRTDDLHNGFYHTVEAQKIEAVIDSNKKVIGWRHRAAAPTILSTFKAGADHLMPLELAMGFVDMPFDIPNIRCENGKADAHTRIGWFRSVYNIPHAFAVQSFVAELAHELGRDHKEFLLELLGPDRKIDLQPQLTQKYWNYGEPYDVYPIDTARIRGVVEMATQKAGWGKQLPKGEGMGLAVHRSFVSYIAQVVRVKVDDKGNLSIPQIDTAIDCGFYVNPERIASQMEGAAVMGYSVAALSALTYKNGRVQQDNYDTYLVARIDDAPKVVNTHIVSHGVDIPSSGVGEPAVPPVAPAICNAIFAATGKRIRSLPIGDQLKA
jgi:isoquinoline 1-oxidoreductase beta subunit